MSDNNYKRIKSIDSLETYSYGTSKDLLSKEEIKCNYVIKQQKLVNYDYMTRENIDKHNSSWPRIFDHP